MAFFSFNTFGASTLCQSDEKVIFSCSTKKKLISVCASKNLSANSGYLQYRIGLLNKLEMEYPETHKEANGLFEYFTTFHNAESSQFLSFKKDIYEYTVFSRHDHTVSDEEGEGVDVSRNGSLISTVKCIHGGGFNLSIEEARLIGIYTDE